MTETERLKKLEPVSGGMHIVLDTDTKNEVDDQFALTYAYRLSQIGKISLDAVYAAPFTHYPEPTADIGMEQSYDEIIRILAMLGKTDTDGFVFKGSDRFMNGTAVDSPAARDLIEKAMKYSPENPLYVVAIGAITNVASAILTEPEIIDRIVVVWLGGPSTKRSCANEYNLYQDPTASRLILDCGVPLVQLPCADVVDKLTTTVSELERFIDGKTEIGTYLTSLVRECDNGKASSRVIWDISTVAYIVHPEWFDSELIHTPRLTEEPAVSEELRTLPCYKNHEPRLYWNHDSSRHFMRAITNLRRDSIFNDLFRSINGD